MKKNGFIMSTYVYILLVFFLLLLGTMLVVLNNTRLLANKIKENTDGNIDFNLVLKGDKEIFIVKDSEYIEPGCIATTFDGEKLEVRVMGEVNAKKSGEYDIEYSAEYKGVEKKVKRKVIVGENVVTYITNLYEDSITRASNNLKKDNTEDKNIRYYGANPNNYVRFNNELWRIIGVFGNNVKLIRNDRLGWLSWDSSESTVNSGYGINQWGESKDTSGNIYEGADLQVYLNKMYYGGIEVTCYNDLNNTKTTCPKDSNGNFLELDDVAKNLIDNHTWNIGAPNHSTLNNSTTQSYDTVEFYKAERGNATGRICNGGDACNDTVERTTTWTGYIGLQYITDYAYASSESVCETNMQEQDSSNAYICKNNNWMQRSTWAWYLSPVAISDNASIVGVVFGNGRADEYATARPLSVFPTMYLKSNVIIESGNGSTSDPYVLKLGN